MDAENMSFPNDSFDCVVLPYVLSVTPSPEKLINEVRRVCKPGAHIIIVNHFSGSGFWWFLEKTVKNIAERIGFRSEFSYEQNILVYDWNIIKVQSVNLFGLSKLIVIQNN
jgi:phosphatidylethanolamine/phosphatidyl-N-methylethanolamine N-methyltransferase